ncbi:tRNA lysidine(34) synthetase TilS [Pseudoalteromonas sp. MMG024]|uniref:tRNA lysidine(34) synthetase TilS n=1 Tax=Pseudoalteromonas sp. MMG024 TaxID=2909980 RepID=UPI001F030DF3|nr:tRNA lysidine(34) synthetase TilS [Pseudoalteromonas sp. MMG024]MCF6458234.1 tRNA lysidine(34) synthetase TilS [Pseudoalteromonas sp. MMG024]
MKDIYSTFKYEVNNTEKTRFTVALSGGVDSVVLLHLAKRFRDEFTHTEIDAVHVNHGLSDNADMWQAFCADLCQKWQIPFKAYRVSVKKASRESLEAVARTVRYNALKAHLHSDSELLLGQHLDDQVETFFIRLKRGAGLLGLGAMKQRTHIESGLPVFRPLLGIMRKEIVEYAKVHQLSHINDESNHDDRFDRNFLRNKILPELNVRFKGFSNTVARVVNLLQSQQQLLDEYIADDAEKCVFHQRFLLTEVIGFSRARIDNLIRYWLQQNNLVSPSQKVLDQVYQQAFNAKIDAQVSIECRRFAIKRYQDTLFIVLPQAAPENQDNIGLSSVIIGNQEFSAEKRAQGVRAPFMDEHVNLRFDIGAEKFTLQHRNCTKSVSTWLKEAGIPPWQRSLVAGIYYNNQLVQVIGLGISKHAYAENGLCWQQKEANEN